MLTALCPPIHRENCVSSKTSRVHGISAMGFALYETKTLTFTQGRPCWNRRLGFPRFFSQIVVPPFLGTKLWFKGGSPFWDPEKQFLSRSVLLKLIRFEWMSFSWKIGYCSWSQKLSPLCRCTKCSMLSVLSFNSPGIKLFSKKAHVGTFKEGTAFLGSDLGLKECCKWILALSKLNGKCWVPEVLISAWYPLCQSKTTCAHDVPS